MLGKFAQSQAAKREAKKRQRLSRTLDIMERLLALKAAPYPTSCNCSTKARTPAKHAATCPYRLLKELIPQIRSAVSEEGKP